MRGSSGLIDNGVAPQLRPLVGVVGLAVLTAMLLHILPTARWGALDVLSESASGASYDTAEDNFPGSAFFYAQGAFSPVQGGAQSDNAHVTALGISPPAPPLAFRGLTAVDRYRATNCLTSAIYYEAGNEPEDGQRAVAQVVLNRVRHPAWPNSVCGVVYQGSERADTLCQFTFSCDGAMTRMPNTASWARARRIAMQALGGAVYAPVGLATHYHTLAVHPNWASSLKPIAVVGAHIFYSWKGMNGTASAFSARYAERELQGGPSLRLTVPASMRLPVIAPIISAQAQPSLAATPPLARTKTDELPESTVRPEFRNSGRPLNTAN